jgi:hypothetical protein
MPWENYHLHEFEIGGERFAEPVPDDELMGMPAPVDERKVRLSTVLGKVGAKAAYTYDFGDGWEHSIAVEKMLPVEPGVVYRPASPAKATVRLRTAAVSMAITICSTPSAIRNTASTRSCWYGSEADSTQTPSRSMRSTVA